MASTLSKRQQARNEKALHDLVHSVPGNNFCADCQARNPGWASWSLGVFLCMRCAAIHRKLGTHVSKVKSLTMDSWSNEQVENMKKVGNITSNKIYNPQNKRPPVPVDADEADSAMERHIRLKYTSHGLEGTKRHNTGSTESDETPPPLPPKTPSRFGLRSASSIFPMSSKAKREVATREAASGARVLAVPQGRRNKASQVFGASVGPDEQDDTDRKLAKLRDMGFTDEQRNLAMLKSANGNLERAVEALVHLGEGNRRSPFSSPNPGDGPSPANSGFPSATPLTPATSSNPSLSAQPTASLANNPFDFPPAQPQSSQSTGTLQNRNPYAGTNPFGVPLQNDQTLNLALQNLSLGAQPSLFPHHTGGNPAPQLPQHPTQFYQQSMTPPMPAVPSAVYQTQPALPISFGSSQTYPQPVPSNQGGYNPFFTNPSAPVGLGVNTAVFGTVGSNPFTKSPTRIQWPTLSQIPEQAPQNFYTPYTPPLAQAPATNNPFFETQPAQVSAQFPRPDKASIMALYNYPHLAPLPLSPPQDSSPVPQALEHQLVSQPLHATAAQQAQLAPEAGPARASNNPFLAYESSQSAFPAAPPAAAEKPPAKHNVSRDSMMALGLEWTNGRHSPDAFASLSARHV